MRYEVNAFNITIKVANEAEGRRVMEDLIAAGHSYVELDVVYKGEGFEKWESVAIFH